MKRFTTVLILFVCFSIAAQPNDKDREERLKTLKVSYFTNKLELTKTEAQKFWPIYNAHENKLRKLRSDLRAARRASAPAKKMVENFINHEEEKLSLLKALVLDLEPVISHDKMLKLIRAEEGFRRELLDQYRRRRERSNKNKP